MSDKLSALRYTLKASPKIALGVIGIAMLTKVTAGLLGIELPDQDAVLMLRNATGKQLVKLLTYVLIGAPIVEELIFRGFMFRLPAWLVGKLPRCRAAAIGVFAAISAAVFCGVHYVAPGQAGIDFKPLDSAFIALFGFGLAQCWLYCKTSRIWCAMLNHAIFNLVNVILALIFI